MDAERWQKIERVFHAALQAEPSLRATILEDSCAGDEPLRRQVEALLAHREKAGTFLETPAFATAKQTSGSEKPPSTSGGAARFGVGAAVAQYRVLAEIGAGGMGIVYKAEDTKLGRLVALKFLPETLATDASALERFQREARRFGIESSQHLHHLRHRGVPRPPVHRDGIPGRTNARGAHTRVHIGR